MQHQGIHYDTGTVFRGPGYAISTRRAALDLAVVRRELEIIRDDLHANAVRIVGSDVGRLTSVAEIALGLGLEVWFSPALFEYSPEETAARLVAAAGEAARLEAAHPGQVIFVAGGELTLFMPGILAGKSVIERLQALKADPTALRNGKLNAYLTALVPRVRAVFAGPLVYASLAFEQVDWEPFDYVGVDHYREARTKDRYVEMLRPFLATGKPVIVTEFGMRTFRGAESSGALGFGVTDTTRLWLHTRPLIGRFFRSRLNGTFERDEAMQAREIAETLDELERSGVAGALLSTFATPGAPTDDDPRYDVDMDSMSIVKALPRGRHGTTYPDMPLGAQGGVRRRGTPLRRSLTAGPLPAARHERIRPGRGPASAGAGRPASTGRAGTSRARRSARRRSTAYRRRPPSACHPVRATSRNAPKTRE